MIPTFKNKRLTTQALTHPSSGRTKNDSSFERLEFLGDRVLGLVIAEELYTTHTNKKEGELAKEFAFLVRKETCKAVFIDLKLDQKIKASEKEIGLVTSHIVSDACEAYLGALFVDQGYAAAKAFILNAWGPYLLGDKELPVDEKSTLQELIQKKYKQTPIYTLVEKTGTDHEPVFKVSVKIPKYDSVFGNGPTRRLAEKNAAGLMLKKINRTI
ncbi:MAG: ribonuclease III [Alphaproteobacteria bacterium CG_4_10_14_0_8_um_filter_37_21]|nr:MAG: ribonuclease III [Alphaproteobacteria bacterium CG_4_10_14_0_8_um_filter_37_21]